MESDDADVPDGTYAPCMCCHLPVILPALEHQPPSPPTKANTTRPNLPSRPTETSAYDSESLVCSTCHAACHLRCAMARRQAHATTTARPPSALMPCACKTQPDPSSINEQWATWVDYALSLGISHAAIFSKNASAMVHGCSSGTGPACRPGPTNSPLPIQLCCCSSGFPAITPMQGKLLAAALSGPWLQISDSNLPGTTCVGHVSKSLERCGTIRLGAHKCFVSHTGEGVLHGVLLPARGATVLHTLDDEVAAYGGVDSSGSSVAHSSRQGSYQQQQHVGRGKCSSNSVIRRAEGTAAGTAGWCRGGSLPELSQQCVISDGLGNTPLADDLDDATLTRGSGRTADCPSGKITQGSQAVHGTVSYAQPSPLQPAVAMPSHGHPQHHGGLHVALESALPGLSDGGEGFAMLGDPEEQQSVPAWCSGVEAAGGLPSKTSYGAPEIEPIPLVHATAVHVSTATAPHTAAATTAATGSGHAQTGHDVCSSTQATVHILGSTGRAGSLKRKRLSEGTQDTQTAVNPGSSLPLLSASGAQAPPQPQLVDKGGVEGRPVQQQGSLGRPALAFTAIQVGQFIICGCTGMATAHTTDASNGIIISNKAASIHSVGKPLGNRTAEGFEALLRNAGMVHRPVSTQAVQLRAAMLKLAGALEAAGASSS